MLDFFTRAENCVFSTLNEFVEKNPKMVIEFSDKGTIYYLSPNAKITLGNSNVKSFKKSIVISTKYSYKNFYERAEKILKSVEDTGYASLFSEEKTDFWVSKGVIYARVEDEKGNMYMFGMREKNGS
mgnify:CR=1 FL=1